VYEPAADNGVLWNSVGIDWWSGNAKLEAASIVSRRDQQFPALLEFDSPFDLGPA
jgi:dTDP-4-dehydrorhamnose 3,5-epimerase-like enzyme